MKFFLVFLLVCYYYSYKLLILLLPPFFMKSLLYLNFWRLVYKHEHLLGSRQLTFATMASYTYDREVRNNSINRKTSIPNQHLTRNTFPGKKTTHNTSYGFHLQGRHLDWIHTEELAHWNTQTPRTMLAVTLLQTPPLRTGYKKGCKITSLSLHNIVISKPWRLKQFWLIHRIDRIGSDFTYHMIFISLLRLEKRSCIEFPIPLLWSQFKTHTSRKLCLKAR